MHFANCPRCSAANLAASGLLCCDGCDPDRDLGVDSLGCQDRAELQGLEWVLTVGSTGTAGVAFAGFGSHDPLTLGAIEKL